MDRMIKAKLSQTLRLGKFMTGFVLFGIGDGKQADAGFFVFSLTVGIYLLLLN